MNTISNFRLPPKGPEADAVARTAARNTAQKKTSKKDRLEDFLPGDAIVYAGHGVGRVESITTKCVASAEIEMIQVTFPGNQMTLFLPLVKARSSGLRKIASREIVDKAMEIIKGKPQVSKGMWARRALAYQEKINSGDLLQLAEVLRDLRRNADSLEGSFSERKLFEAAQERFVTEVAVMENKEVDKVLKELTATIKKL